MKRPASTTAVCSAVVLVAVLANSCALPSGRLAAPRTTASSTTTTELPVTPLDWSPCGVDIQCATLTVPLDSANPGGPTISIAVARHPAEDPGARIGSLVIDPGGPGLSGIDDMANELTVLTPRVLNDFDIVMFDARGVGRSDPITCGESARNPPANPPDPVPVTTAQQAGLIAQLKQYAAACEQASPQILPHVGTVDVAMDLDRLRRSLGDTGLTYMGQSYGSLLGLTYALRYPTHVRAMVLDGVIDPAISYDQFTKEQADSFEATLNAFLAWCAGTAACSWRPPGNATAALLGMLTAAVASPAPAGVGRSAGAGELYDALLDGLYSRTDWPRLGAALAADAGGNGAAVVAMSDRYNDAGTPNQDDAEAAIDCLDHPVSRRTATYGALAESFGVSAPIFGPLLAWGEAACSVWPARPTRTPGPVAASGAPPILVVGTINDPATPYGWAVSVSHELDRGVLLTREGNDHVAYFYSSCVREAVESYLVAGVTPSPGAVCSS